MSDGNTFLLFFGLVAVAASLLAVSDAIRSLKK